VFDWTTDTELLFAQTRQVLQQSHGWRRLPATTIHRNSLQILEQRLAMANQHNDQFDCDLVQHPLPADAREIKACLLAARRCYDFHPYFYMRYGEHGSAFARSDGGYLATLVDEPQAKVDKQVFWLAAFLAKRGLPRWLMETHLDLLCEELSAAVPERIDVYQKLHHAGDRLREARTAWISQVEFDRLMESFDATSGGWIERAGGLMGAAVCDECCGLTRAVPSLMSWMDDTTRFSPQWCAAVNDTLGHARAIAAQAQKLP
jgi:hypothetical protein